MDSTYSSNTTNVTGLEKNELFFSLNNHFWPFGLISLNQLETNNADTKVIHYITYFLVHILTLPHQLLLDVLPCPEKEREKVMWSHMCVSLQQQHQLAVGSMRNIQTEREREETCLTRMLVRSWYAKVVLLHLEWSDVTTC